MKLSILFALLLAGETLDNEAVLRMVKASLPADIIVLKIEQSQARFDVSTDALIALKAANVPDAVIKAMLMKAPAPPAPPPSPPAPPPAADRCMSVRYYTTGNNGWNWYPANLCVTSSAVTIDEESIPLDQIVAHCSPRPALIDIGGASFRGTQEWWLTDGRELHKLRGKSEEIEAVAAALARAHPASRHGSCGDRDIRKLLPRGK